MTRSFATRTVALITLLAIAFSGCATGEGGNSTVGKKTVAGGALGAAAGGLLGGAIGNHLDQRDKEIAAANAQRALEASRTGESSAWRNPDSGHEGTFTPTRTYQREDGRYCREYQQTVTVDGETQKAYGTACRQPDGSWKIES